MEAGNTRKRSHSPWTHLHRCRTQSGQLIHSHPKGLGMRPLSCPCWKTLGAAGCLAESVAGSTNTSRLCLSEKCQRKQDTLNLTENLMGTNWSWLIAGVSIWLADTQDCSLTHRHTLTHYRRVCKRFRAELESNHAWANRPHCKKTQ